MGSKVEIDGEAVELLARLLTESNLTEIEYKQGETHIRVGKSASQPFFSHVMPSAPPAPANNVSPSVAPGGELPPPATTGVPVTSPLVGTVYTAPDPSAPPFVTPGTTVQEGQTLLIVEAMKVMNPIRAPHKGTIQEICVDNGSPVEYGEVLLYLVA